MKKKKILIPLGANFLQPCSQHIFSILEEKSNRVGEKRFFKESENKLVNISI